MVLLNIPQDIIVRIQTILATKSFYFGDDDDHKIFYPKKGLPQGSPLSPILFLIAMQLMAYFNKDGFKIFIYADDISAVLYINNSWELPIILNELVIFINKNASVMGLKLNPDKTKIIAVAGSNYVNKKLNSIIRTRFLFYQNNIVGHLHFNKIKILGNNFNSKLNEKLDLTQFKKILKIAKRCCTRALRLQLSYKRQYCIWKTWAIAALTFLVAVVHPNSGLYSERVVNISEPDIHPCIDDKCSSSQCRIYSSTSTGANGLPKLRKNLVFVLLGDVQLAYFKARGRAEITRFILAAASVKYNDNQIAHKAWVALKPKTPLGQLPVVERDDDNIIIPQNLAIARYFARKHGLAGDRDLESAMINSVVDTALDGNIVCLPILYRLQGASKEIH
ncbi:hypothetical protein ACOME3_004326 [Neoechinorhynchus agilis]